MMLLTDASAPATLFLYTPTPPIQSGTADYIDAIVQHLPATLRARFALRFACETHHFRSCPSDFRNIPIDDFRAVTLGPRDVAVYFVANNHYHYYVLAALRAHRRGRAVSMIHDPSCVRNVAELCGQREYGFTHADLPSHLETEFGADAARFSKAILAQDLPDLFLSLGQSLPIRHSAAVLVHSFYARTRLLLETRPSIRVPPIYVVQHPDDAETSSGEGAAQSPACFVVSTFGWQGPPKRTIPLVEAFARFWQQLPLGERRATELRVVGVVPSEGYDIKGTAMRLGIGGAVRFFGYVKLTEMERLMRESHLVFNLRYPSRGESSGTLRRCHHLRIPVVTTRYAAFHEELSDFQISPNPTREVDELGVTLATAYAHFRAFGNTHRLVQPASPSRKLDFWDGILRATHAQGSMKEAVA